MAPYVAAQWESLTLVLSLLDRPAPGDGFPFRYAGPRAELIQLVDALLLCQRIVPTAPHARPVDCHRHLLSLLHLLVPDNLSDAIAKALARVSPERNLAALLDDYRRRLAEAER